MDIQWAHWTCQLKSRVWRDIWLLCLSLERHMTALSHMKVKAGDDSKTCHDNWILKHLWAHFSAICFSDVNCKTAGWLHKMTNFSGFRWLPYEWEMVKMTNFSEFLRLRRLIGKKIEWFGRLTMTKLFQSNHFTERLLNQGHQFKLMVGDTANFCCPYKSQLLHAGDSQKGHQQQS